MTARQRMLAEQAQRDAEVLEAIDAHFARVAEDAERQRRLSADRMRVELESALLAYQGGLENARALDAARRRSRSRYRETTQTPGGEQ
jgi:hypothetical protein